MTIADQFQRNRLHLNNGNHIHQAHDCHMGQEWWGRFD